MSHDIHPPAPNRDRPIPSKGDILVVDDRPENLRLLSTMLTEQGYKVRKVIKGELTLGVAQVNPPDLILLDIMMPNISGFEVCEQLKADVRTQAIPVIFLSALDEPMDKVKAFAVGGEDYITKPFEIQEVVARIEHQLRIVRLQRQLREQNQQLQQEVAERQKAEAALQSVNNELETQVEQRTAELTQANQQLTQLGQQLQQSLKQEQQLNQLRSQIITTISHEYRTPMSIIGSSAGLLETYLDSLTPENRYKHFRRIDGAIQRMTQLIDDVIFLNELEWQTQAVNVSELSLTAVIADVIQKLSVSGANPEVVEVAVDQACDRQRTDPWLITRILQDLLSNAIKFSPQNSRINVKMTCSSEHLIFEISDQGIGIPPDQLDKVLNAFHRARNAEHIPGAGLGLTIVQKCLQRLQGTMTINSTLDGGTVVDVRLPLHTAAFSQQQSSPPSSHFS